VRTVSTTVHIADEKAGTAEFAATATGDATGVRCALAKAGHTLVFKHCAAKRRYARLKRRRYTFEVRAVGPGGTDETPAKKTFTIKR
jgi:hypothetical protein